MGRSRLAHSLTRCNPSLPFAGPHTRCGEAPLWPKTQRRRLPSYSSPVVALMRTQSTSPPKSPTLSRPDGVPKAAGVEGLGIAADEGLAVEPAVEELLDTLEVLRGATDDAIEALRGL